MLMIVSKVIPLPLLSKKGMTLIGRMFGLFHSDLSPPRCSIIIIILLWLILGTAFALLGLYLHTQNLIPIVPAMMTPSYCLWTCGSGLVVLSILYGLMALPCWLCKEGHWPGYPFVYMGRNPLVIYAGHVLLKVSET